MQSKNVKIEPRSLPSDCRPLMGVTKITRKQNFAFEFLCINLNPLPTTTEIMSK